MKRSVFFLLFVIQILSAQTDTLTYGLVLSGGTAKGLAHIGALKALEQRGIRPSYVAGTSMGAIIGGLYAAGYSPNQIDSIAQKINFNMLFSNTTDRRITNFVTKSENEKFLLSIPLDGGHLQIPSGISNGQNTTQLLELLTSHLHDVTDFDDLPIPFFCMVTDLNSGEAVRIDSGKLSDAIRASAALPSLLLPYEIDGKTYVDGGVTNNFPILEMKNKKVDKIIGLDVSDGKEYDYTDQVSLTDLLMRLSLIQSDHIKPKQIAATDYYIKIKSAAGSAEFDKLDDFIAQGYKTTILYLDSIALESDKEQTTNLKLPKQYLIHDIEVIGNDEFELNFVKSKLKLPPHNYYSKLEIKESIDRLIGSNQYDLINFSLKNSTENPNGKNLVINLKEKQKNKSIGFGLHYDRVFQSSVLLNYTHKKLFTKNSLLYVDLIVGDYPRMDIKYWIDNGTKLGLGIHANYQHFNYDNRENDLSFFQDDEVYSVGAIHMKYQEVNAKIFGSLILNNNALRLGVEYSYKQNFNKSILEYIPNDLLLAENYNHLSAFLKLESDALNDSYFPTKGSRWNLLAQLYGGEQLFDQAVFQISGDIEQWFSLRPKLQLKLGGQWGLTMADEVPNLLKYRIGGNITRLTDHTIQNIGFETFHFSTNNVISIDSNLQWEPIKDIYILPQYQLTVPFLSIDRVNLGNDVISAYGGSIAWKSFFGPIRAVYSKSSHYDKGVFYFSVGYHF